MIGSHHIRLLLLLFLLLLSIIFLIYLIFFRGIIGVSDVQKIDITEVEPEIVTLSKEVETYRAKLLNYKGTKFFDRSRSVPQGLGFWQIQQRILDNSLITINSSYETQITNGLKNSSIVVNKTRSIDYYAVSDDPILIFSPKFAEIFAKLVINANLKVDRGISIVEMPVEEQAAYLLSSPNSGEDVLKDQKYIEAFENVRKYALKQNQKIISELKTVCDQVPSSTAKNQCYFELAIDYIDDFDCGLLEEGEAAYKSQCYQQKSYEKLDPSFCLLAKGVSRDYCEGWFKSRKLL